MRGTNAVADDGGLLRPPLAALWVALSAVLAASMASAGNMQATYIGPSEGYFSDPTNWSTGVVPNNAGASTFDVFLPGGLTYVRVDQTATIDNLTASSEPMIGPGLVFTVNGTTSLLGGLQLWTNGGDSLVSLGSLAQFSTATKTLASSASFSIASYDNAATVRFNDADIVTNLGNLELDGRNAHITDQNGSDALRHLANNAGSLAIGEQDFATAGAFSNGGTL